MSDDMQHPLSAVLTFALLTAAASAQVFVVDAANGPGTNFTSLATAVAAVPEGAVLDVRPGSYLGIRIDDKSLTIVGGPGVAVRGPSNAIPALEIANLGAGKFVSVRGIAFDFVIDSFAMTCQNSAGAIVLEDILTTSVGFFHTGRVVFTNCANVTVRNSHLEFRSFFHSAVECYNSNVAITDTDLFGMAYCFKQGGGRLALTRCVLDSSPLIYEPAVGFMAGGELLVNGDTQLQSSAGAPVPSIFGEGNVIFAPSVTFAPTVGPVSANVQSMVGIVPEATADPGTLGGAATAALEVPTGASGALFVGFPGIPTVFPGVEHPIWLAPGAVAHAVGGGGPAGSPLTGRYAVPNSTFVLGVQITWQGIVITPAAGRGIASNPATYTHTR